VIEPVQPVATVSSFLGRRCSSAVAAFPPPYTGSQISGGGRSSWWWFSPDARKRAHSSGLFQRSRTLAFLFGLWCDSAVSVRNRAAPGLSVSGCRLAAAPSPAPNRTFYIRRSLRRVRQPSWKRLFICR